MAASFCPSCGTPLSARFCGSCGADSAVFATPAAAPLRPDQESPPAPGPPAAPTAETRKTNSILTAGLRECLHTRLGLSLVGVLAADSAALITLAVTGAILSGDNPSPWLVFFTGLALVVFGWGGSLALRLIVQRRVSRALPRFIPFFTVTAVLGVLVGISGLVVAVRGDSYSPSESLAWWPLLLAAAVLIVLWAVPGLQGRPFMLGTGLVVLAWGVTSFVGVTTSDGQFDFYSSSRPRSSDVAQFDPHSLLKAASLTAFLVGVAYLLIVLVADWFDWRGLATPFIVAGIISAASGAIGLLQDPSLAWALPFVAFAIGLMLVGVFGQRKASTWLGGLALAPALIILVTRMLGRSPERIQLTLLWGSAGLLVLAAAVAWSIWGPTIMAKYAKRADKRRARNVAAETP
jgi:hypothetical protein